MREWISDHQGLLWTMGVASVVIVIASALIIPALVVRIPADYFSKVKRPRSAWANQRPLVRVAILIAKNLAGMLLMVAGLAMLALPGQGLLTLAVGFFLVNFPGKYRLEKWLVRQPGVLRPINWLRKRRGRAPLRVD